MKTLLRKLLRWVDVGPKVFDPPAVYHDYLSDFWKPDKDRPK